MITEKQLLKWGFTHRGGCEFRFVIPFTWKSDEYVFYFSNSQTIRIITQSGVLTLYCDTKRRADQALHLMGLTSIDKLKEADAIRQRKEIIVEED